MATIVEMINPLTGLPEQVDKLDHTAQEIDDAVDLAPQLSNPNLLDNWYFGNPINQRGQTSYTGAGYTIDRWIFDGDNASMLIEGSGLHFVFSASATGDEAIHQRFENPGRYSGKAVTYSMLGSTDRSFGMLLLVNGSIFGSINSGVVAGETIFSYTAVLPDNITSLEAYYYPRNATGTGEAYLRGCKLELGDHQTLAHQDENGNWVLNEIPDYGEQLARCQRHQLRVGYKEDSTYSPVLATGVAVSSASIRALIPTPVTMRENPVISFFGSDTISTIHAIGNGVSITPTEINARVNSNGIFLNLTVSGATVNETYAITLDHARGLMLDANL